MGKITKLTPILRNIREEMNDESDAFLELFSGEIEYVSGGRTQSGFYTVVKPKFQTRLYRGSVDGKIVGMESVPVSHESLDPRFVFLLHTEKTIFIWKGWKSSVSSSSLLSYFHYSLLEHGCKQSQTFCREA